MTPVALTRRAGCRIAGSVHSRSFSITSKTGHSTLAPATERRSALISSAARSPLNGAARSMRPEIINSATRSSSSLQKKALDALRNSTKVKGSNDAVNSAAKPAPNHDNPTSSEQKQEPKKFETPTASNNDKSSVSLKAPQTEAPVETSLDTPEPKIIAPNSFRSPPLLHEFAPRIVVVGIGGGGGNSLNNMIAKDTLSGVDFLALNTDAQHLSSTLTDQRFQLGTELTQGLGCGANPDAGRQAAEGSRDIIREYLKDAHLVFITCGLGGGTGTGASPVVADICYEMGILTVGVVTLPFTFEGTHRSRLAREGLNRLKDVVDTLIVVPNQNLFNVIGRDTPLIEAFQMADDVLLGGVKSISDLMTSPGLINLDFADVQAVMLGMGYAMIGTGVASGSPEDNRSTQAAKMALENPLLSDTMDISSAKGVLVNISGGADMTLHEVSDAAELVTSRIQDDSVNIMFGSVFNASLENTIRVSVVATGIDVPTFP